MIFFKANVEKYKQQEHLWHPLLVLKQDQWLVVKQYCCHWALIQLVIDLNKAHLSWTFVLHATTPHVKFLLVNYRLFFRRKFCIQKTGSVLDRTPGLSWKESKCLLASSRGRHDAMRWSTILTTWKTKAAARKRNSLAQILTAFLSLPLTSRSPFMSQVLLQVSEDMGESEYLYSALSMKRDSGAHLHTLLV